MTMVKAQKMGFPCMQPDQVRARGSTSRAAAAAFLSSVAESGRAGLLLQELEINTSLDDDENPQYQTSDFRVFYMKARARAARCPGAPLASEDCPCSRACASGSAPVTGVGKRRARAVTWRAWRVRRSSRAPSASATTGQPARSPTQARRRAGGTRGCLPTPGSHAPT